MKKDVVRANIIAGVKYKSGSVKILELEEENKFVVEVKEYLFLKVPFSKKRFSFASLEEAESVYERYRSLLYRKA